MAIDRTGITSLNAGAGEITYSGNQGPKSPDQQLMAQGAADVLAREQMRAKGASDALMTRLGGEEASRKAEAEKVEALMGLESGRLTSATEALTAARQQTATGFGQILGGVAGGLTGDFGKKIGGKLKKGFQKLFTKE